MLCGEERAREIDLERFIPAWEGNLGGRALLAEYAGVVESDVEAAVAVFRAVHHRFGERFLADVAGESDSGASLPRDFTDERIQLRLAPCGDDHLGAGAS